MEEKPLFKNVKPLLVSDVLAGVGRVYLNGDKSYKSIGITMAETALYKYAGRILGEHTSTTFLTGSGVDSKRLIEDKELGKRIEDAFFTGIISQADRGLRKGETYWKSLRCGSVDALLSLSSDYFMENIMGGDDDLLTYIKSINPFNKQNQDRL